MIVNCTKDHTIKTNSSINHQIAQIVLHAYNAKHTA